MPGAARLGDKAKCPMDAHGCKACSHCVQGPATQGSKDVITNNSPALRVGDQGIHAACCGPNKWVVLTGAPSVFINGKRAARQHDITIHCGGVGKMIEGSGNVIIGNGQARLFQKAAKSHIPFVANVASDQRRKFEIMQQNMEYLAEKGCSSDYHNSKLPDNIPDPIKLEASSLSPQAQALIAAAATAMPLCPVCAAAA